MSYKDRQKMIMVYKVRDAMGWVALLAVTALVVGLACCI